jgi:DNA-binding GntR family transcriptional regulator
MQEIVPTEAKTDLRIPVSHSRLPCPTPERILRGELRAGDQLVQHTIATELGLSGFRFQALRQLEAEDWSKSSIIEGRVASLSDEILEMFSANAAESRLLHLAIPRMTDED